MCCLLCLFRHVAVLVSNLLCLISSIGIRAWTGLALSREGLDHEKENESIRAMVVLWFWLFHGEEMFCLGLIPHGSAHEYERLRGSIH